MNEHFRKIVQVIVIGLLLLIGIIIGYFTIFRAIDAAICVPQVSKRLGIPPDQSQIYQYVKKQLVPGLNKTEVMERLRKVGSPWTNGTTVLANGRIREGVELKICLHPLNNISIINSYSKDWVLLGTYIEEDSP